MKKVILFLLNLAIASALHAQIGIDSFPKAINIDSLRNSRPEPIKNIDSLVREINLKSANVKPVKIDSLNLMLWLEENHIVKIEVKNIGANYHSGENYYFKNDRLVLASQVQIELRTFFSDRNTFYYEYDEVISQEKLQIIDKDTLFWGIDLLKQGYKLFDQFKHLQNFNPFDSLVYDEVVAYDFDGKDGREIVMDGKLVKDAKNPKTVTKEQAGLFIQTITDTATYGFGSPGYFEQTIGIVFYNNKKIAAHISISFDANSLKSSVYLPATQYYFDIVAGDDYYTRYPIQGFSPQARKQLRKLCSELGLKNCPTKDGIWDGE